MEETQTKFNWKRSLITVVMIVVAAGVTGGTTYYVLNQNFQKEREANQMALDDVRTGTEKNTTTAQASADQTATWKTFSAHGFSVKYPTSWVYKDYSLLSEGADAVGFAETTAKLAPEQADGYSTVDIRWSNTVIQQMTEYTSKLITENITTKNGYTGWKYTLLPGRTNDMGGDNKEVIYQIKLPSGIYVTLYNVNDQQKEIFDAIAQSVK